MPPQSVSLTAEDLKAFAAVLTFLGRWMKHAPLELDHPYDSECVERVADKGVEYFRLKMQESPIRDVEATGSIGEQMYCSVISLRVGPIMRTFRALGITPAWAVIHTLAGALDDPLVRGFVVERP